MHDVGLALGLATIILGPILLFSAILALVVVQGLSIIELTLVAIARYGARALTFVMPMTSLTTTVLLVVGATRASHITPLLRLTELDSDESSFLFTKK